MYRIALAVVLAVVLCACSGAAPRVPRNPSPRKASLPAPADAASVAAPIDPEAIARDVVAALVAHDFAAVASRFDKKMSAALPVDKLSSTWTKLGAAAAAFDRVESVRVKPLGGVHVVSMTAHCATTRWVLRISIDDRGYIGGLYIRPGDQVAEWQPPAYARLDTIEDRPVTVGTRPALPGTLTLPRGAGPFPAVVLVHGSGPSDADETIGATKMFKDLALGLASRGVAVLRYEKRTHAFPAEVRTQKEEVDDAAHAAVALLRATPGLDSRRIVLLGHSQGGYLAPRIAEADPAIRGLVILAGSTRPLEDSILAQLRYLAAHSPGDAQLSSLIADAERFKRAVESPGLQPDDALGSPISGELSGTYFLEVRGYRPEKVAASLAIPIIILQGERDYQVTVADDFSVWKAALGQRRNVTFHTYPDANHVFVTGTDRSTPAEYLRSGHVEGKVIDDIAAWIATLGR